MVSPKKVPKTKRRFFPTTVPVPVASSNLACESSRGLKPALGSFAATLLRVVVIKYGAAAWVQLSWETPHWHRQNLIWDSRYASLISSTKHTALPFPRNHPDILKRMPVHTCRVIMRTRIVSALATHDITYMFVNRAPNLQCYCTTLSRAHYCKHPVPSSPISTSSGACRLYEEWQHETSLYQAHTGKHM